MLPGVPARFLALLSSQLRLFSKRNLNRLPRCTLNLHFLGSLYLVRRLYVFSRRLRKGPTPPVPPFKAVASYEPSAGKAVFFTATTYAYVRNRCLKVAAGSICNQRANEAGSRRASDVQGGKVEKTYARVHRTAYGHPSRVSIGFSLHPQMWNVIMYTFFIAHTRHTSSSILQLSLLLLQYLHTFSVLVGAVWKFIKNAPCTHALLIRSNTTASNGETICVTRVHRLVNK